MEKLDLAHVPATRPDAFIANAFCELLPRRNGNVAATRCAPASVVVDVGKSITAVAASARNASHPREKPLVRLCIRATTAPP